MEFLKRLSSTVWDILESVTFALTFVFIAYLFFFQPMEVHGASSYPTIKDGERVFVEKITPKFRGYQRGDFVIPQSPTNPDVDFIKRIIGKVLFRFWPLDRFGLLDQR